MKLTTVVVGLLLAFLLFTPQGRGIAELAMGAAMDATKSHPASVPAKTDAEVLACKKAWHAAHPGQGGYYAYVPCY